MGQIVDLSHRLEPGMPNYPGIPEPVFGTLFTHDESKTRGTYAPGTTFQIALYQFGGNTGTYLDAPFHRHPDGIDLADLPLECTVNILGVVIDAPFEGPVGPDLFKGLDLQGTATLVRTGWSRLWGSDGYFRSGPYLTRDAAESLVEARAALVGIDSANIDNMEDSSRPVHTVLLGAGIPVVEHLTRLQALGSGSFRFFAPPPAISAGTTFTVRAFALSD